MFRQIGILLIFIAFAFTATAQETLPSFTLINKGNNRIICSWTNPYGDGIKQLTIQRSSDSLKNFKSILTLPDPTVPQNGYVDTKAPAEQMFYRIYILLDSGKYIFSPSKRPFVDSIRRITTRPKEIKPEDATAQEEPKDEPKRPVGEEPKLDIKKTPTDEIKIKDPDNKNILKLKEVPERIFFIKRRDSIVGLVGEKALKKYKDSVQFKTKDTLGISIADTVFIKAFVPKVVYKPSRFVFTEKDGNVKILLPDALTKKYSIRFFDENNTALFEIKQIRDKVLLLDKSNFMRSGWFKFELVEDGQVIETHKLFIPKDF